MNRSRAALLILAKIAISAVLLFLVLRRLGSGNITAQLRQLDLAVCFALVPQLLAIVVMAARWHALAFGLLTFRQALRYTLVGLFYGALLPGGVSGDVAKGAAIALRDHSARSAILPASIIADRLIGLYVLGVAFCIACGSLLWRPPGDSDLLARLGAYGLLLSAPVVLLMPLLATRTGASLIRRSIVEPLHDGRSRQFASRLINALDAFQARPNVWPRALLLSAAVHTCNVIVYLIILSALRLDVPVHLTIIMYAVLSVLMMVPISISGLGVREWFTLAYFPAIGLAAEAGVAFSLTYVALTWIVAAVGGIWHLLDLMPARRKRETGGDPKAAAR